MAKEKASRIATKKVKDKWKAKSWYTILANDSFGKKEIGSSPASSPEEMVGRVSEASLSDITGDYKQSHVKLFFRVTKTEGDRAFTEFEGHEINQDYIRRMIRRRKTRIDLVVDAVTSDNVNIRIKPLIIVDRKVINNVETGIRNKIAEFLKAKVKEQPVGQFVVYMLSPQIYNDLYDQIKVIYPAKKIEIRSSEIFEPTKRVKREEKVEEEPVEEEEEESEAGVA
ncbi:MAG: 30S ribosomal protein S3ae [Candidatus Thermoplasmatota archaeon]|nr:30S ribosomal protein S3ae [Candidatus Thermoplasmatota archaeon]MCL6002355.1 30S ribosomal protein S3ae [Candidatus Thermoplasmatota archaeon]